MVSENQSNASGDEYDNEAERILQSGMDPRPMIRGIESRERALMYHRAAHELDCGRSVKEAIAEKLRELDD